MSIPSSSLASVLFFFLRRFGVFFIHRLILLASLSSLLSPLLSSLSPLSPPNAPSSPSYTTPLSVALLFIAMSSQGSAATKAFSCCHYNYSLHTCAHTRTHAHTHTDWHACIHTLTQERSSSTVSLCLHVCACSACAVIHKRVSYFYLSPSLPPLLSPPPPPPPPPLFIPLCCCQPHLLCWAQAVSVEPNIPPLAHWTHTRADEGCSLGIPQISSLF